MTNFLVVTYFSIGFISALYILFMYIRGVYTLMVNLYTKEYFRKSNINIQFGYNMGFGYADTWWGAVFMTGMLTLFHIVLSLLVWPLFSIWLISYTIKVAREKKFGDGRY
jgi:hypothetical protein